MFWTPAFAGVTAAGLFTRASDFENHKSEKHTAVNDTIIADPDPPQIVCASELHTPSWPSVCDGRLDLFQQAFGDINWQGLQLFSSRSRKGNRISLHLPYSKNFLLNALKRFPSLTLSFFGPQYVAKILPYIPVGI